MAQLQLSDQLIQSLHSVLQQHDEQARDSGVAAQYLAAALGFTVATLNMATGERRELLEELGAFAQHVRQDVERQMQSQAPAEDAFGVWRPGDP